MMYWISNSYLTGFHDSEYSGGPETANGHKDSPVHVVRGGGSSILIGPGATFTCHTHSIVVTQECFIFLMFRNELQVVYV